MKKKTVLTAFLYRAVIFPCVQQLIVFLRVRPDRATQRLHCLSANLKGEQALEMKLVSGVSMEKGFDRGKNRISLIFLSRFSFTRGWQV